MKFIYLYLLDTMADWEVGHALAELNSQRYFASRRDWQVRTCALVKKPVTTLGGMTIMPDLSLAEIQPDHAVILILPGADRWMEPAQAAILAIVRKFIAAHIPVAAICGATGALAEAGMLDAVRHTSNGRDYLKMFCPHYRGQTLYQEELAVTDGNIITAGSSSAVEFACHIFRLLGALGEERLKLWYGYFGKHSAPDLLKLLGSLERS